MTLPIIDEVKDEVLNLSSIEKYCKCYTIFTTDISFVIRLFDERPDAPIAKNEIVTTAAACNR